MELNGREVTIAVCRTCHVLRPLRSAHSPSYGACVAAFDHDCGVLQTCVAARTFRWFVFYLYGQCALCAFVFARTVHVLTTVSHSDLGESNEGRWRLAASYLMLLLTGLAGSKFFFSRFARIVCLVLPWALRRRPIAAGAGGQRFCSKIIKKRILYD